MKIYDCFMFFDEEMLLDLRLNIMDKYVDKFIITEAKFSHSGQKKKLNFIVEANFNVGLALSLIRVNFKYISLSQEIDDEIIKKIQSMAKKNNVIILFTKNPIQYC